jgi:hypothetical protein
MVYHVCLFQRIKVSQVSDLFPMLKELYHKGPTDAFYIVKVWVRISRFLGRGFNLLCVHRSIWIIQRIQRIHIIIFISKIDWIVCLYYFDCSDLF